LAACRSSRPLPKGAIQAGFASAVRDYRGCVVLSKIDEDITGSLDVIPRRWFCNRAHGNWIAARSATVSHQFGGWVRRSQVRYPSARRRLQTSWASLPSSDQKSAAFNGSGRLGSSSRTRRYSRGGSAPERAAQASPISNARLADEHPKGRRVLVFTIVVRDQPHFGIDRERVNGSGPST
jgi:hypothetical protein